MNPVDFTGERYIPGQGGCQIAYEHLHRYLYALRWAGGKRVLDLACGVGYGSSLLARHARQVWAVDLDEDAVRCARRDWRRDNVFFIQGDATRLPFQSNSMDLVVAMEALEHIGDQEKLVQEIARVVSANGLVLISTPNRAVYSDARQYANPFHVREFYLDEFVHLMKQYFPYVEIAGQRIRAGSLFSCDTSGFPSEVLIGPDSGQRVPAAQPMYFLAICSTEKLREPVPGHSAYLDTADELFQEVKQEINRLNEEITGLGRWAKSLEDVIKEKDHIILDLQNQMKQEVEMRDQSIRDLQSRMKDEVEMRDRIIRNLRDEVRSEIAARDQQIVDILNSLHQKEKEFDERGLWALSLQAEVERLERIHQAFLYKALSRFGLLPK